MPYGLGVVQIDIINIPAGSITDHEFTPGEGARAGECGLNYSYSIRRPLATT